MILLGNFIKTFSERFIEQQHLQPWEITKDISIILVELLSQLNDDYVINDGVAIHKTAIVESGAILKAPVIISEKCMIAAHAYLRGGVYLLASSRIGPGCEIKSSIIFCNSAIAHFNFIGDSLIGNNVNFEAGSIIANHYNEKENKEITLSFEGEMIYTGSQKFGALVGDHCRIGANAVLSPGTILQPGSIVKRLELIDQ